MAKFVVLKSLIFCSWQRWTSLLYVVNIMDVDDLVMQGARASATMILTEFSWNISVPPPEVLSVTWWIIKTANYGDMIK